LAVAVGAAPTRAEAADAVPAAESAAPADLRAADARGLLGSGFDPGPGWTLQRAEFGPELARLHFRGPEGAALVARVSPLRPGERAFAASAHFAIAHEGQLDDTRDAAALALLRRVADAIRAADDGSVSLPAPVTAPDAVEGSRPPEGRARFAGGSGHEIAPLADFQLGVAALLLALVALALLLRALPTALAALWALPERVWVFGALAVAAALRLAVPSNLVTMFMGYRQTDSALLLADIPRYGAGVHLLHHLTLQVLPVDHESILSLHRVCAIATLPLVAAFVARLSGRPHAATAAAVLLGSAPLMIRDGATESNLLPVVLGLWIGLWLLRRALDGGGRLDALGALAGIGYAMIGRPEQLLVAPLLAAAVVVSAGTDAFRRHRFALLGAGVMLAVLAVPHAVNTFGRSSELHSGLAPLLQFPFDMFMRNVVFWPTWFPAGITLAAIAAVALSAAPARRGQLALWAAALVWGGTYLVDLPHISVPRLMAGSATVVCAVAGVGVPLLRERLAAVASGRRWTVAVFAVWLLSAVATLPRVFEPSNQQLEEQLFREALRMLPPQPACVQRLGDHDPPYGREVHRYHPDYLFRAAGHRVLDLREDPARFGCRETFVLLGTRCYARDRDTPTQPGPNRSCRAVRARHRLVPLWEREQPVLWDDPFTWWRQQEHFRVGVYRIAGAASDGGRPGGPAVR
ncbi:MAG: hypothetical protein RIT45_1674, partial [Pseudomonadota bacterium]